MAEANAKTDHAAKPEARKLAAESAKGVSADSRKVSKLEARLKGAVFYSVAGSHWKPSGSPPTAKGKLQDAASTLLDTLGLDCFLNLADTAGTAADRATACGFGLPALTDDARLHHMASILLDVLGLDYFLDLADTTRTAGAIAT